MASLMVVVPSPSAIVMFLDLAVSVSPRRPVLRRAPHVWRH